MRYIIKEIRWTIIRIINHLTIWKIKRLAKKLRKEKGKC